MIRFLSKKKISIGIAVVILIVICIYAIFSSKAETNNTTRFATVKKTSFTQKVTISGTITPFRQTIITAPYAGYVKKLYVKVGQKVKTGDPLVSIVESLQTKQTVYPIRAPYAGTVVLVQKSEGEFVKQNDPTNFILKIDDLHKLYVKGNVPEINIPKIIAGQQAVIRATPILDKTYKGVVKTVSLAPKPQQTAFGRTQAMYPISIAVIGTTAGLNPGMSAIVDIIIAKRKNVMTLPHEFVHKEGNQYFVITADGKKKLINVGLQSAEAVVIKKGVTPGTKVKQIDYFNE